MPLPLQLSVLKNLYSSHYHNKQASQEHTNRFIKIGFYPTTLNIWIFSMSLSSKHFSNSQSLDHSFLRDLNPSIIIRSSLASDKLIAPLRYFDIGDRIYLIIVPVNYLLLLKHIHIFHPIPSVTSLPCISIFLSQKFKKLRSPSCWGFLNNINMAELKQF